ncbi:septum formation initiator family protein [Fibrobacterota bacterium]
MPKPKKKWKFLLFLLPLWLAYSWLNGDSSITNQIQLYRANQTLLREIDSLTLVESLLDKERAKLRSDTVYLEKVIRSELGMARPNEKVYQLY